MIKTLFHTPNGEIIKNIELEIMKKYIVDEFDVYWLKGSGDGFVDLYVDEIKSLTMMIGPNSKYGIYLHIIDRQNNKDWISVYDKERLAEVVETADEIYASIGLFLPIELAWEGIKEFMMNGTFSKKVIWEEPDIIPEEGNW